MKWFPSVRLLIGARRDLRRIASALERIADAAEGKLPLYPVAEADLEPISVADDRAPDYARMFHVEQQLRETLGRDPDPDEVMARVEDREWNERDAEQQREKAARYGAARHASKDAH